jgi:hypothetical protein
MILHASAAAPSPLRDDAPRLVFGARAGVGDQTDLDRPRPDIVGLRADDAAALLLLEDVRAPACRTAHREQGGEDLARDLERLQQQRGVVLDIGVEPPTRLVPAQRRDRALLDLGRIYKVRGSRTL